jgi:hypothetical protein
VAEKMAAAAGHQSIGVKEEMEIEETRREIKRKA